MTKTALTLALVGCLAAAQGVMAQQASHRSATLRVTAEVVRDCRFTVNALAFGAYDPIGANTTQPLDTTSSIELTCTQGVSTVIQMDGGATSPNKASREMAGPAGARLAYEIHTNAQRTVPWGNARTVPSGMATGPAPSNAPRTFVIYGRIPAGQGVPAGTYADEIVLSIQF